MKKIIFGVLILISIKAVSQNSDLIFFKGNILASPDSIEIIISLEDSNSAYLFVPEQFLYKMQSADTYYDKDSLYCSFKKISANFSGKRIEETNVFSGIWTQGQAKLKTELEITDNSEFDFLDRPQTPQPPFPYLEKEICVENIKGNSTLCGTLTIPDTLKSYPLLILITGSGAQDRNEEIAGHKPFMVIADFLTKNGIAVFRYDDRGVGKSKGDFINSTTYDFMTDAQAVLNYFSNFPNIDNKNIGVLGHSEGGLIAFMLAAKKPKNLNYIISLAGPGVAIKDLLMQQFIDINKSLGYTDEHIEILSKMQSELLSLTKKNMSLAKLRKEIKGIYDKYSQYFSEEEIQKYKIGDASINTAVMQLSSPWMKYFINIKPQKYLRKIKCTVFAMNGSNDLQVNMKDNLGEIKNNIKSKNGLVVNYYDGLNHMFQNSETGEISEYYKIKTSIEPYVLEHILEFITHRR
ncbi:MAG: alpha/beta fold hydrolase [Bacteroidales bacterium]|jgi:pimeloyl-ACP methyl ester carboxylesterase|nr:alpha/beta fold hydrolase [Bacteroidales bacterium]MCK9500086.1 alpha/beta fold hydrolase [Bacteroidales bacterium]MDY0315603.1 alpha/beta fold hydrolase [Bacteroidales bacterium]NLB87591.1 alpha/beta fold hydrolase [Bacteroidales bacterium]